jgi:hypothetical protein
MARDPVARDLVPESGGMVRYVAAGMTRAFSEYQRALVRAYGHPGVFVAAWVRMHADPAGVHPSGVTRIGWGGTGALINPVLSLYLHSTGGQCYAQLRCRFEENAGTLRTVDLAPFRTNAATRAAAQGWALLVARVTPKATSSSASRPGLNVGLTSGGVNHTSASTNPSGWTGYSTIGLDVADDFALGGSDAGAARIGVDVGEVAVGQGYFSASDAVKQWSLTGIDFDDPAVWGGYRMVGAGLSPVGEATPAGTVDALRGLAFGGYPTRLGTTRELVP